MLFLPSQVLTIEQATSRVQYLIDLYKKDNERLPSWTLPASNRAQTDAALAVLIRYVLVLEAFLVKLGMFFPDDVVRTVIAIVVCTHHQQELLSCQRSSQHSRYIMTHANALSMSQYLDAVSARLLATLQWVTSDEGKLHRRIVNEAICNMQSSLDHFTHVPPSSQPSSSSSTHPTGPSRRTAGQTFDHRHGPALSGPSRWDVVDLSATQDLQLLMRNFVPLGVAYRRAQASAPAGSQHPIWHDPTNLPRSTPSMSTSSPDGVFAHTTAASPPSLARVSADPALRRREGQRGTPPVVPQSPMRLSSKRQRRGDGAPSRAEPVAAKRTKRASTTTTDDDNESSSQGGRTSFGSPVTSAGSTAVASDDASDSESDSDYEPIRQLSASVASSVVETVDDASSIMDVEPDSSAEARSTDESRRSSWLDILYYLFVRRR
ncbi:hypothetical protein B0H21DRAFT_819069 [Amylocystis lapponica]|nr:hypothetical protein B0H21DRAFT_819069 [Amylocystis lapponica]